MDQKENYVTVEIEGFTRGIRKIFDGVSDVFASLGVEIPEHLQTIGDDLSESAPQKKRMKKTKGSAEPEPSAAKFDTSPDDEPPFDVNAKDSTSTPEVPDTPEVLDTPETTDAPKSGEQEETSITPDDITKIIVQKIKQNRSNNQRIGQLLKTYDVSKVSELPRSKYEAFITDLAAM